MEIHILLVEEEYQSRYTIRIILESAGYRVTDFDDAENGLAFICSNHNTNDKIDILVTSLDLSRLNGIELIDEIDDNDIHLKTIALGSYGDQEMFHSLRKRNNTRFLYKPFHPEELLGTVAQFINS